MGNFFDQKPFKEFDEFLISYIKTKNLKDIQEVTINF